MTLFFISSLNVTEFTIEGVTDGVREELSLLAVFVGTCDGGRDCMADGVLAVSLICAVGVTDGLGDGMVDGNSLFDPVGNKEGTCDGDSDGGPTRRGSIAFAIRSPLIRNEVAS